MHQHATSTGANISILLGIAEQVPQTVILHQRRVFHEMTYRQIVFYFIFYVAYTHMNIASEAIFISGPCCGAMHNSAFAALENSSGTKQQARKERSNSVDIIAERAWTNSDGGTEGSKETHHYNL